MQYVPFSVVVLAATSLILGLLWILSRAFQILAQANQEQRETITSLTKLAAAKDIAAFHGLEATHMEMVNPEMPYSPRDDESIARDMMARYASAGIDPNLALSADVDPLEEFGGPGAFH